MSDHNRLAETAIMESEQVKANLGSCGPFYYCGVRDAIGEAQKYFAKLTAALRAIANHPDNDDGEGMKIIAREALDE
jgi:hypothetical protein